MSRLYYLATPYSQYQGGTEFAYRHACQQAGELLEAGVDVFSPIAHSHSLSEYGYLDGLDHAFWMKKDRPYMQRCDGLIVVKMEGYQASKGVREEIFAFQDMKKPIYYMEFLGEIPREVLPKARKLVALAGYATSGKDSAAKGLTAKGWTRVSFADGVREAALAIDPTVDPDDNLSDVVHGIGWDRAKKEYPEVRRLLQVIGTEAGRNIHGPDCWTKLAQKKIEATGDVVITDVRFESELELVKEYEGKLVHIERPGVGPVNNHPSEQLGSLLARADFKIVNDGSEAELQEKLVKYVEGI